MCLDDTVPTNGLEWESELCWESQGSVPSIYQHWGSTSLLGRIPDACSDPAFCSRRGEPPGSGAAGTQRNPEGSSSTCVRAAQAPALGSYLRKNKPLLDGATGQVSSTSQRVVVVRTEKESRCNKGFCDFDWTCIDSADPFERN